MAGRIRRTHLRDLGGLQRALLRWHAEADCDRADPDACIGLTSRTEHILLAAPARGERLIADRGTLLHEMVHQYLNETGQNPRHAGQPWCDCIMRLNQMITGRSIYATPDKIGKEGSGKSRSSYRYKPVCEATGAESLPQKVIARWPHDEVGIKLGPL